MSANLSLGLIGWPLEHSLSPQMHNAALQYLGISGSYRLYPVPPPESSKTIRELLAELRHGIIHGLNVTIPYKWEIQNLVDDRSAVVETIGAANTIFIRNGKIKAENTDVPGLLTSLRNSLLLEDTRQPQNLGAVLVLGAGGAARAAIYVANLLNRPVYLAARRLEQADGLANELSPRLAISITPVLLSVSDLNSLPEISLVINTTPAGMWPNPDAMPWPENYPFPDAPLLDMIYNPPVTKLMRFAQSFGAEAGNGLDMLVEQAALSLELWSGCEVSRAVMRQAALSALEK